eukprot:Tbor_TRINITY_DN5550_c0_g2::TRINITY_DN5550_c0_g2_i1::g.13698::m.13698
MSSDTPRRRISSSVWDVRRQQLFSGDNTRHANYVREKAKNQAPVHVNSKCAEELPSANNDCQRHPNHTISTYIMSVSTALTIGQFIPRKIAQWLHEDWSVIRDNIWSNESENNSESKGGSDRCRRKPAAAIFALSRIGIIIFFVSWLAWKLYLGLKRRRNLLKYQNQINKRCVTSTCSTPGTRKSLSPYIPPKSVFKSHPQQQHHRNQINRGNGWHF